MTKVYEQIFRGKLEHIQNYFLENDPRGEFCILVEGNQEGSYRMTEQSWESWTIEDHVTYYIEEKGMTSKEAIKMVAQNRKISKRDVYQAYHVEE